MKQAHILISGRVQGVLFRANTRRVAKKLGLVGFIRNLDNGRVEIVAEGSQEKLKGLIDYCKRGPIFARVENIEVEYKEATNRFDTFEILR